MTQVTMNVRSTSENTWLDSRSEPDHPNNGISGPSLAICRSRRDWLTAETTIWINAIAVRQIAKNTVAIFRKAPVELSIPSRKNSLPTHIKIVEIISKGNAVMNDWTPRRIDRYPFSNVFRLNSVSVSSQSSSILSRFSVVLPWYYRGRAMVVPWHTIRG